MPFDFSVTEPGVPYNVTVRAITTAGLGKPVSIVVFAVQQGNFFMSAYPSYDVRQKFIMACNCLFSFQTHGLVEQSAPSLDMHASTLCKYKIECKALYL